MTDRHDVLLVDDHPVVRRGLAALLADEAWVGSVYEAADVESAVRSAVTHHIDVVAMDVGLPDGDGIEATRRILAHRADTAVLMLTLNDDDEVVSRALRAGARGYLLKDSDPDEVVQALHAVARGGLVVGPGVMRAVVEVVRGERPSLPPPLDALSPRELEILAHLGAGHPTSRIARELGLAEKTVRNQFSVIFTKINVPDRFHAALLARDAGLEVHR